MAVRPMTPDGERPSNRRPAPAPQPQAPQPQPTLAPPQNTTIVLPSGPPVVMDYSRSLPATQQPGREPVRPPTDAAVVYRNNQTGTVWVMYNWRGINFGFAVTGEADLSGLPEPQNIDESDIPPGWVNAGTVDELGDVRASFGSFGAWVDTLVRQAPPSVQTLLDNEDIRGVFAQFIARPDMGGAELENRLRGTATWQSMTDMERNWAGLSDADKQRRRQEVSAQMAAEWQRQTGQMIDVNALDQADVDAIASGRVAIAYWAATKVREAAMADPNSPVQRQLRNEEMEKRQRGFDISSWKGQVRALAERWGVQASDQFVTEWATKIVDKQASDADLVENLKDQAQALYSWKPRDLETRTAAEPWLNSYSRLMERNVGLFDRDIQDALTRGTTLPDFERQLMSRPEWLQTKNAANALTQMAGEVGRRMGFV